MFPQDVRDAYISLDELRRQTKANLQSIIQISLCVCVCLCVCMDGFKAAHCRDVDDTLHYQWKDTARCPSETVRGEMNHILLSS